MASKEAATRPKEKATRPKEQTTAPAQAPPTAPMVTPRPVKVAVPQKECEACGNKMSGEDPHSLCVYCLGYDHVYNAVHVPGSCKACAKTNARRLKRRLTRVQQARDPALEEGLATERAYDDCPQDSRPRPGGESREGPPAWGQSEATRGASPVRSWGEEMDETDPLQDMDPDNLPEYDHIYHDYSVVDEVGGDDGETGHYYGDSDSDVLPSEEDERLPPNQAAAAAATSETGLAMDDTELIEIFRKAAERCGTDWPAAVKPPAPEKNIFHGIAGAARAKPAAKQLLPIAEGCMEALQSSWQNPLTSKLLVAHRHVDCARMREEGLEHMPPMDAPVAAHLLRTSVLREPTFTDAKSKEFSGINRKAYNCLATSGKMMSAAMLLQGSATSIYVQAGDKPSPEDMKELRRLHDEVLQLSQSALECTGRAMAHLVVLERARWLELAKDTKPDKTQKAVLGRQTILDQPISQQGLFSGVIDAMTEQCEVRKKQGEAMDMFLPMGDTYRGRPQVAASRAYVQPSASRGAYMGPPAQRGGSVNRGGQRGQGRGDGRRKYPSASPARSGPPQQPPRGGWRGGNKKAKGT